MSDNVNREKLRAVLESAIRAYLAASAPSPSSSGWTPTSDGPEPIEYECELCGGRLDGPYEKCGSAQHGPNGTVIYGRAVPVSPIPDSEFTASRPANLERRPSTTGEVQAAILDAITDAPLTVPELAHGLRLERGAAQEALNYLVRTNQAKATPDRRDGFQAFTAIHNRPLPDTGGAA